MSLTNISDRLTPSLPTELTFGAQPLPVGQNVAVLIGTRAAAGGSLAAGAIGIHEMVNVGDASAAQKEVDDIAGEGSEAGKMARAFVAANSLVSTGARSSLPRFKMVVLPAASDALTTLQIIDALKVQLRMVRCDWLVSPWDGLSAETAALRAFGISISGPDYNLRGQFGTITVAATLSDVASALASSIDTAYSLTGVFPDSSDEKTQTVAEVSAGLAGLLAQNQFPYYPLDNEEIGGLLRPKLSSDVVLADPAGASEALLKKGMAPLTVDVNGNVRLMRARNNRVSFAGDGVTPATAYLDVQDIQPLFDFREDVHNMLQGAQYKNKKATERQAEVVSDGLVALAQTYEEQGAFQNVKALAPKFRVEVSKTSRGRFDFYVPADVSPGNHVIAGNIQALVFSA